MDYRDNGPSVQLQKGSIIYFILLIASFISTQAMRSPVSAVLFIFLMLLPIISLICALIGRGAISVYVSSDTQKAEKDAPVGYEIRVINNTPIPYPFLESVITRPREDGIRCLRERMYLSLAPFGGYIINKTVSFRYRGLYEIGVSHMYLSDMLRLVRFRIDIDNYSNVVVYPRILDVQSDDRYAYTELPSVHAPMSTAEMAEAANIREYRMGDSQKAIHWKLSSKTEELQVKDFSINRDRNVYIFADLSAQTPCPETKKGNTQKMKKRSLVLKEKRKVKLSDAAGATLHDKKEKIGALLSGKLEIFKRKKSDKKRERLEKSGDLDGGTMDTIEMIDRLIEDTARAQELKRKEEKKKRKKAGTADRDKKNKDILDILAAEEAAEKEMIDRLYESINDVIDDGSDRNLNDAVMSWGGKPAAEYEDDMAEFCADGIVEIALSAVKRELNRGNRCTLVWYDSREDRGYHAFHIASPLELEAAFNRFSGASTVPCDKKITDLIRIINESMNVTVKFVTANIDPISLSEYCAVPAMFGGAGAGCTCEIMLFNPEGRYVDSVARREYGATCKERLISAGIHTTEFKYLKGNGSGSVLVAVDF
ncbi:MAG: DUF58 domain-containing protein [Clostridia bacterium]|nr:DUF58 domain-containing protein [Clostridia bacterium]